MCAMSLTETQYAAALPKIVSSAGAGDIAPDIEIKLSFFLEDGVKQVVISVPSDERRDLNVSMDDSRTGNFKWGYSYTDAQGNERMVEERDDFDNNRAAQPLLRILHARRQFLFDSANFSASDVRVITARMPWNPENSLTSGRRVLGLL